MKKAEARAFPSRKSCDDFDNIEGMSLLQYYAAHCPESFIALMTPTDPEKLLKAMQDLNVVSRDKVVRHEDLSWHVPTPDDIDEDDRMAFHIAVRWLYADLMMMGPPNE